MPRPLRRFTRTELRRLRWGACMNIAERNSLRADDFTAALSRATTARRRRQLAALAWRHDKMACIAYHIANCKVGIDFGCYL